MSDYASQAARLQAENETLRAECELLRAQVSRLTGAHRTLLAREGLAQAENERLQRFTSAIEQSWTWRFLQALRSIVGRKW